MTVLGTRLRNLLLVLAIAGTSTLLAAPEASAHVQIESTTPTDGDRLAAVPAMVTITLSENIGIQHDSITVTTPDGTDQTEGPVFQPAEDARTLAIRLRPDASASSTYLVRYAFVSTDNHPVRGSLAFVVGTGPLVTSSGAASSDSGADPLLSAAMVLTRWLGFCGMTLAGGVLCAAICLGRRSAPDHRALKLVWVGCAITVATAALSLAFNGPYVTGVGLSGVLDPALLATTFGTPFGRLLILRVVAAVVVVLIARHILVSPSPVLPRWENFAVVAGLVLVLTSAAAGHAVSTEALFITLVADVTHFAAVALWLGGLVLLSRRATVVAEVRAFTPVARAAIAATVISGSVLSVVYLNSLEVVFTTTYGLLLLAKSAGYAVLLYVGDRMRAKATAVVGDQDSTRQAHRLMRSEIAIGATVLLLAAVLSTTGIPPA